MGRSKLHALVRSFTLLASVGAPCLAHAADLLPPPPPPPAPIPVDVGGGWYLRGDVGVGATNYNKVSTNVATPGNYAIENAIISDSYFAGGGVGYQFNSFLRGDVTAEYRGSTNFRFVEHFDYPDNGNGLRNGIDTDSGKLRSIVTMANGYFDLGTWYGVTPYIGGGVGAAFHQISGFIDQGGASTPGFGLAKDKNTTSLAWNLQAGLSFDVTPNFKVDVGYRYLDMGHAKTGAVDCVGPNTDCVHPSYKLSELTSHDVKIGLRYMLGTVAAAPLPPLAPAYEPAPLVRKY